MAKSRTTTEAATGLHPWVKLTQASLEKAKPGMYDVLLYPGIGRLNVEVSKGAITRSMLIWDRLLRTMESNGLEVKLTTAYPARTIVTVDGEPLSIRLRERVSRIEQVQTAAERERMEQLNLTHYGPTWDYRPSGNLILTIDHVNCHNQTLTEVTWADTPKRRIEDRLDSFADVLVKAVKEMKRRWAAAKERDRIRNEEQRKREDAARLQVEEKKRKEELERQASGWTVACSIRHFIHAVQDEAVRRRGGIDPGSPLEHWLQWAERHAASIDPVGVVLAASIPAERNG